MRSRASGRSAKDVEQCEESDDERQWQWGARQKGREHGCEWREQRKVSREVWVGGLGGGRG